MLSIKNRVFSRIMNLVVEGLKLTINSINRVKWCEPDGFKRDVDHRLKLRIRFVKYQSLLFKLAKRLLRFPQLVVQLGIQVVLRAVPCKL
jgi:hypothetical protein